MKRQIVIPIGPSIAYIPLTKGLFSCIDVDDVELVSGRSWYASTATDTGMHYARSCKRVNGVNQQISLGRLILGIEKNNGKIADHINNAETLDNRRANLRSVISRESSMNRRAINAAGFKGIYSHGEKWQASIGIDKKRVILGDFLTKEEAGAAYIAASRLLHGEFGNIVVNNAAKGGPN